MSKKSDKSPTFTVQVKVVAIADVDVEANTLEEALEFGKNFGIGDIVKLDPAAEYADYKVSVVGAWSQEPWGTGGN